jgi:DNA-binding transcriptional regulator GbsR (MarR family)
MLDRQRRGSAQTAAAVPRPPRRSEPGLPQGSPCYRRAMAAVVPANAAARAEADSAREAHRRRITPPAQGRDAASESAAEEVRLAFADAWGSMGPAWGVQPSVARVHGYLLARDGVQTEREVREALGLSHRAASLALAETEAWGLIERVPDPRRSGRRGPTAMAYVIAGDRWRWLQKVAERRREREADPLRPEVEHCLDLAEAAADAQPEDPELRRLRDWIGDLLAFMGLFDRAVNLISRADTAHVARAFSLLGRLPDESLDRLLNLFVSLPEDELVSTLEAVSRVSPSAARRVLTAASRVARLSR